MLPIALPIEPVPRPVEISLSFETLRLPPVDLPTGESIGTLGVSYRQHVAPNWVAGLGFYGAVSGRRGGFLAWGVTGAYQQTWGPWQGEAGLFVGGGGGGPAWTGSGLMLRPHAEISRFWGDVGVGFGVSHVRFPDGKDGGSHVYGALKWRTDGFFGPAGGGNIDFSDALAAQAMPAEYAAMAGSYRMRGGPPSKDGAGSGGAMHFAGFVYRRALTGQWLGAEPYALLSLAGSAGGGYEGYAEALAGLGLQWNPAALPALRLRTEAAAGVGGAGFAVDTGGGAIGKLSAGASVALRPDLALGLMVGALGSRGNFKAGEARLELAFTGWEVVPGAQHAPGRGPQSLTWLPWEASAGVVHQARMPRADGSVSSLDVLALRFARELGAGWRVLGQAATAVNGGAGGYAAGTFGAGWMSAPLAGGWRLGGEATVGAAGGGLVDVAGGAIWQAQAQARYPLTRDWSLQAEAGLLRSWKAGVSTPVLGLNAVYSFSRLEGR